MCLHWGWWGIHCLAMMLPFNIDFVMICYLWIYDSRDLQQIQACFFILELIDVLFVFLMFVCFSGGGASVIFAMELPQNYDFVIACYFWICNGG